MENGINKNNRVLLTGEIIGEKEFSHEVMGEEFYMIKLGVQRLSGVIDAIPVMISNRHPLFDQMSAGTYISVNGQYRSHSRQDKFPKLMLFVFALNVFILDAPGCTNDVSIVGYICKRPVLRKTVLGRDIADVLLAVNRSYGKSDYIPSICWGRNALYVDKFPVGECVIIRGRIQSREYKKIIDNDTKILTAYELSINSIRKNEMLKGEDLHGEEKLQTIDR